MRRKRGRIIAVVDEIEAARKMPEDAQRLVDEGRQSSEARRAQEKREKDLRPAQAECVDDAPLVIIIAEIVRFTFVLHLRVRAAVALE